MGRRNDRDEYFQRDRKLDLLNFVAWQMLIGTIPFVLLLVLHDYPSMRWSPTYALLMVYIAVISMAVGFLAWIEILRWLPAGAASLNLFAVPVIALLASMAIFGERLTPSEWGGIACIGVGLLVLTINALRTGRGSSTETGIVVAGEGG